MQSGQRRGGALRAVTAAIVMLLGTGMGTGLWLDRSNPAKPGAVVPARQAARAEAAPVSGEVASVAARPADVPSIGLGPFRRAWVSVPVATIWNHPATARPEDAPAVSGGADVSRWVTALTDQQKLGLDDLLATQALLYQPLFVYGHDGGWDHVLVLGQKGSVYPWGVAGWLPAAQVSFQAPPAGQPKATVDVPVLHLGGLELSYGTEMPVAPAPGGGLVAVLPTGRFLVPTGSLRTGAIPRSGLGVVAQAERFLGLPYLWGGTSSFGYDCSGLTYSVYRMFGITLPRDAGDQAGHGTAVQVQDLEPGDLVFFAFDGKAVDHVGIYAGHGMMVDSPHTGAAIELVPLWGGGRASYYAGARRYL